MAPEPTRLMNERHDDDPVTDDPRAGIAGNITSTCSEPDEPTEIGPRGNPQPRDSPPESPLLPSATTRTPTPIHKAAVKSSRAKTNNNNLPPVQCRSDKRAVMRQRGFSGIVPVHPSEQGRSVGQSPTGRNGSNLHRVGQGRLAPLSRWSPPRQFRKSPPPARERAEHNTYAGAQRGRRSKGVPTRLAALGQPTERERLRRVLADMSRSPPLPGIASFEQDKRATKVFLDRLSRAKLATGSCRPTHAPEKHTMKPPPKFLVDADEGLQILGPCLSLSEFKALREALVAASDRSAPVSTEADNMQLASSGSWALHPQALRSLVHELVCRVAGIAIQMEDMCLAARASDSIATPIKDAFARVHPESPVGFAHSSTTSGDVIRDRATVLRALAAVSGVSGAVLYHLSVVMGIPNPSIAEPWTKIYCEETTVRISPTIIVDTDQPQPNIETPVVSGPGLSHESLVDTVAMEPTTRRFTARNSPVLARIEARRSARKSQTRPKSSRGSQDDSKSLKVNYRRGLRRDRPLSAKADNRPPRPDSPTDPRIGALTAQLFEIEPPTGLLRLPLYGAAEVQTARNRIEDAARLIDVDLPRAAATINQPTIGPLFQSLLSRHAIEFARESNAAMYAARDDRAGGAELDLSLLGAEEVNLAKRVRDLVLLLRIKIEDDGDLQQASKTLRDFGKFFEQLSAYCVDKNMRVVDALTQLRR